MRLAPSMLLVMTAAELAAHPHAIADQQAHLSLAREGVVVTYYLAPSIADGADVFAHIDTDRDARLSREKMMSFAHSLVRASRLIANGREARLTPSQFAFPSRGGMAAGRGVIRVRARAEVALKPGAIVRFEVQSSPFAPSWFLQPFYADELARAMPRVQRPNAGNAVLIRL